MPDEMSILRTLHRMHRQVADLQGQLDRIPRQRKTAQVLVDQASQALADTKDRIKQKKMEADRKQLQLREREAKLQQLEVKQNQATNNREYQTLKEQRAADTQANNVLSDEILEVLEEIDRLEASLPEVQRLLENAQKDQKSVEASLQERSEVATRELQRVMGELKQTESTLSGDARQDYQRAVQGRGEDGMAELEGQFCGGCNTILTAVHLDRLKMARYIVCPSCGRVVYSPAT